MLPWVRSEAWLVSRSASVASCPSLSSSLVRTRAVWRASRTAFPSIGSIDVRQRSGFGIAHFVCCPILEGGIGRSLHRVFDDRGRRSWFRRTLPCKQVHTNKQAKQDRANQRQADESLLL